jgi:Protein of unknown function (DUF1566)
MSHNAHFVFMAVLAASSFGLGAQAQVSGQGNWETTLQARNAAGDAVDLFSPSAEFFYDTTTDVTWMANTNVMDWNTAKAWAAGLNAGGHTDWRLPRVATDVGCTVGYSGTNCGFNVQTQVNGAYSEWAYMYYVTLGNKAQRDPGGLFVSGYGLSNTAYFRNMQSTAYWSDTPYVTPGFAWLMFTGIGYQTGGDATSQLYAVAVRSGDVGTAAVLVMPEPSTQWTVVAGLGLLALAIRRRGAI